MARIGALLFLRDIKVCRYLWDTGKSLGEFH
jgi:hypothetical protein